MFSKRVITILLGSVVIVSALLFAAKNILAEGQQPNWFAPVTPAVAKIVDYENNDVPVSSNYYCHDVLVGAVHRCAIDSNIGTVLTNGQLKIDDDTFDLTDYNGVGTVLPVPNSELFLTTQPGATTGQYVAFHRTLDRSNLKKVTVNHTTYTSQQYQVTKDFDYWLTDSSGNKLQVNTSTMAFSKNGAWMIFDVPRTGLFRINLATMDVVPFGPSPEQSWFFGTYNLPITVTDDGKFAALGNGASLMVYDLSGCLQTSYSGGTPDLTGCKYRDAWLGQKTLTGGTNDLGIQSTIQNGAVSGNLRFIDDGNIAFDAQYDRLAWNNYKTANYVVTAQGATMHKLGLLGLGDSYISGEGEMDYFEGTDDLALNMCHLSPKSYPYLLGAEYFNDYESVACSGAVSADVYSNDKNYTGQFNLNEKITDPVNNSLLSKFTPGYLHQNDFNETYQPEAIVLSIGGNNVGFSDIVKSCILSPDAQGTCYATYEDRYALMQKIDDSYQTLLDTYNAIKFSSPGTRIYVVGYPQIVKPGGICELNVQLNQEETGFASELVSYLDATVQRAASAAGVYYVDTQNAFDGHRLCEATGASQAMNGLTAGKDIPVLAGKWLRVLGKETYHPTVLGHQLLADTIANKTKGLSAKMPTPKPDLGKVAISGQEQLLQNVPHGSAKIYKIEEAAEMVEDVIDTSTSVPVSLTGLPYNTLINSTFQTVLHSDPISLGDLKADANGDIRGTVTIPDSVPAGFHTLHLYGKDMDGQDIDIQKVIYVTQHGYAAFAGQCQVVAMSGVDVDQDKVDDACDPVIGNPVAATTLMADEQSSSQQAAGQMNIIGTTQQAISHSVTPQVLGTGVQSAVNSSAIFTGENVDWNDSTDTSTTSPSHPPAVLGAVTAKVDQNKQIAEHDYYFRAALFGVVAIFALLSSATWMARKRS